MTALFATGCLGGGKRLAVSFAPQGGSALTPGAVQLVVVDQRASPQLVGPQALSKDLLRESQGGLLDLTTTLPTGSSMTLTKLTVQSAVYEAVKNKLATLGITANPDTAGAKARVTINILEFDIDVEDSNFMAHVSLQAVIDRPGINMTHRSAAKVESPKFKLVGDMGSNDAISDGLNKCINTLDFTGINSF
jgi:hypothetical protein